VVVDQGGQYDDDDEYEGGPGPMFTPPTKPRAGNHGAAGGFDHGDHGVMAVRSRAAAGDHEDPIGSWWLRPRQPWRGNGRVSHVVRWQRAASEIRLVVGSFNHGGHGAAAVMSCVAAAGRLGNLAGDGRLRPRRHNINGCRSGSGPTCRDPELIVFLFFKIGLSYLLGTADT
jgi:hypothetical protein